MLEFFVTLLDGFCSFMVVPKGLFCRLPNISDVDKVCARVLLGHFAVVAKFY